MITSKKRVEVILSDRDSMSPTDIVNTLSDHGIRITPSEVVEHVKSINRHTNLQIYVNPPECRKCGFTNFADKANIPSTCPDCRSTWIAEPRFYIDA